MGVFERIKERLQHAEAFEEDDGHLLEEAAAEIARLRAVLREIDAMIPQYIDFVQPTIRKALGYELLTGRTEGGIT